MARRLELSLTSVGAGREGDGGADVVDSGEAGVDGDVVQSLEGGMKPSRSALALALTLPLALALGKFLTKEAFDTVICTGEMIWMSILYVSCTWWGYCRCRNRLTKTMKTKMNVSVE